MVNRHVPGEYSPGRRVWNGRRDMIIEHYRVVDGDVKFMVCPADQWTTIDDETEGYREEVCALGSGMVGVGRKKENEADRGTISESTCRPDPDHPSQEEPQILPVMSNFRPKSWKHIRSCLIEPVRV